MLNKKSLKFISVSMFAMAVAACSNTSSNQNTQSQAQPVATVTTPAATEAIKEVVTVSSGTFSGRSDHITLGQVSLEKTGHGYQLRFAADFSLDGAPDPIVAVGNNETYLASNKLGSLKSITGGQIYALPADFTPAQFSEVYVWCKKFSVPLGVATLKG